MSRIDNGYDLAWDALPPITRDIKISKSSLEYQDSMTKAISEMLEACTASALHLVVRPMIINPLGIVLKSHLDKLRLLVNMSYVNENRFKRVFKF